MEFDKSRVYTALNADELKIGTFCMVCGEFVELNEWEARHAGFRLCDECIKAIKFAKTLILNIPLLVLYL